MKTQHQTGMIVHLYLKAFVLVALLQSCAFGPGSGMLANFTGPYNLDPGQLDRNCDMKDSGACLLTERSDSLELKRVPILQGLAPPKQAIFSAQLPLDFVGQWFLFHRTSKDIKPLPVMEKYPGPSQTRMEIVEALNLTVGEKYELILVDQLGQVVDRRFFSSPDYQKPTLKFALVSCLDDSLSSEQKAQWSDIKAQNPNVIFFLGDNVYLRAKATEANPLSRETIWNRYGETRAKLDFYYWESLVPAVATWDDNDYGGDDETNPSKETSRWVHEVYFPLKADMKFSQVGPGTAKSISWANQTFLFFDNRSFRSPDSKPLFCQKNPKHERCNRSYAADSADSFHFGRIQEEWAFRILGKEQPAWLLSGDQWFGDYHPFDSFEGNHRKNFSLFLDKIAQFSQRNKVPYVFLSGDRHLAEVMEIKNKGYRTYEFTSSGLHAKTYPEAWKEFTNPRKILGFSGLVNYMLFESQKTPAGDLEVQMDIRSLGQSLSKKSYLIKRK